MKINDKTKYAYVITIIRALESRMLKPGDVERMIEAKNAQEAYRVLNDLDYAEFLGDIEKVEDFQIVINEGLTEVKDILVKNAPDPEILDIIWLRYDFHNLKVLLKAHIQGKSLRDVENILMPFGKYSPESLERLIQSPEGILNAEEQKLAETIKEASAIYEKEDDPTLIDVVFDKTSFETIHKMVSELKSDFLMEHQTLAIDLKNICAYLRCLALDKKALFSELFIKEGSLNISLFQGNMDEFTEKMQTTKYSKTLESAAKVHKENRSFLEFEREADSLLINQLRGAHYITFGIEPLFAFFWIKENNAQVIRTIMVNKLNKIAPVEIRKKIRKIYQ